MCLCVRQLFWLALLTSWSLVFIVRFPRKLAETPKKQTSVFPKIFNYSFNLFNNCWSCIKLCFGLHQPLREISGSLTTKCTTVSSVRFFTVNSCLLLLKLQSCMIILCGLVIMNDTIHMDAVHCIYSRCIYVGMNAPATLRG